MAHRGARHDLLSSDRSIRGALTSVATPSPCGLRDLAGWVAPGHCCPGASESGARLSPHRAQAGPKDQLHAEARTPVSGQLWGTTSGGAGHLSRFPVVFRLPAFSSRVILSPLGVGLPLRSAYRAVPGPRRDSMFHTHQLRPGRVPSRPRGRRCSHGRSRVSGRRLPHPSVNVPAPRSNIHHPGLNLTGHHRGFTGFTRPTFPWPVTPGWNGSPWASPPSSTPCRGQLRRYRRRTSGWGLALSTGLGLRSRRHRSTLLSTRPRTRIVRPRVAPRDSCMRPERIKHVGNARLLGLSSVAEAVRAHSLSEPPPYRASALDITVVVGTTIEIWL